MTCPLAPRSRAPRARSWPQLSRTSFVACVLGALACGKPDPTGHSGPAREPAPAHPPTPSSYGEPLSERPSTPLANVLAQPAKYEGQVVLVEGHVRRACSRKGCWMELSTAADDAAPGCRVTFQDYAFFVPTDSRGKSARVEAKVQVSTLKAAHVEHLESEGGTFRHKNPDGSAREIQLVASGVELISGSSGG